MVIVIITPKETYLLQVPSRPPSNSPQFPSPSSLLLLPPTTFTMQITHAQTHQIDGNVSETSEPLAYPALPNKGISASDAAAPMDDLCSICGAGVGRGYCPGLSMILGSRYPACCVFWGLLGCQKYIRPKCVDIVSNLHITGMGLGCKGLPHAASAEQTIEGWKVADPGQ